MSIVHTATADIPTAGELAKTAAELYLAAVRALGQVYRGDDETLIRVADTPPECEGKVPGHYIAVTLKATAAAVVMLVAFRALTPGRGDGTRGMLTLCNLAEAYGVTLELQAAPLDHVGSHAERMRKVRQLVAWYKRFGFKGSAFYMVRNHAPKAKG